MIASRLHIMKERIKAKRLFHLRSNTNQRIRNIGVSLSAAAMPKLMPESHGLFLRSKL